MSPAKQPIKISVIDEDATNEQPNESKKQTALEVEKKDLSKQKKSKSVVVDKKVSSKNSKAKKPSKRLIKLKKGKSIQADNSSVVEELAKNSDVKNEATNLEVDNRESKKNAGDSIMMSKKKLVTDAISEVEKKEGQEINLEESLSKDDFAAKLKMELEQQTKENDLVDEKEEKQETKASQEFLNTAQFNPVMPGIASAGLNEGEDREIQEIVKEKNKTNRSINIYKKVLAFFGALLFLCVVAVLYFVLVKVTIIIVPDQERMSNNLIFDVKDLEAEGADSGNKVSGIVRTVNIQHEKTYPATGEEVIGKEAVGKITLINSYTKNQMLVATTRLLTPDGKLFRLKNTVNIPAGGEIEAEIYADDPSPEMAVEPTKFNIPGLWAGLQDKIYGESKENIIYQQKVKRYAVQENIDSSTKDMRQQLLVKAKTEINKEYEEYDEIIYNLDEDSIKSTVDAEAGDEVDEIVVTMTADVIVIAFEGVEAAKLAEQKFVSSLPVDKELINFDAENIIYSLNNFNSNEGSATINATFEGKVSLKETSDVIEKEKIVGLNEGQLKAYLDKQADISGYDVKFSPSFLPEFLRRVPRLPERIETEIKK